MVDDQPWKGLHLGSGDHILPGWVNADSKPARPDRLCFDATRRFPFGDDEFDLVFSEHMIEHMTFTDGAAVLRECVRVLKPNGRLRITTPDINFLIKLYTGPRSPLEDEYLKWASWPFEDSPPPDEAAIFVFNRFVRAWGHLFIYDPPTLSNLMTRLGLVDIEAFGLGESRDPRLCGLENAGRLADGFLQLESFTLEATKPEGLIQTGAAGESKTIGTHAALAEVLDKLDIRESIAPPAAITIRRLQEAAKTGKPEITQRQLADYAEAISDQIPALTERILSEHLDALARSLSDEDLGVLHDLAQHADIHTFLGLLRRNGASMALAVKKVMNEDGARIHHKSLEAVLRKG